MNEVVPEHEGREFVNKLVSNMAFYTVLAAALELLVLQSTDLKRTVFTLGFCYLMYQRRNWARLFAAPIWSVAGFYIAFISIRELEHIENVLGGLFWGLWLAYGIFLLYTSLTLLFSRNVRMYFSSAGQ